MWYIFCISAGKTQKEGEPQRHREHGDEFQSRGELGALAVQEEQEYSCKNLLKVCN
jgi:hypothetical protein